MTFLNVLFFAIKVDIISLTFYIDDLILSVHVTCICNLLNKLRKSDKMRGLPSILSHFRNKFNKINNTRARMLDSIYRMASVLLKHCIFGVKTSRYCHLFRSVIIDVTT